MKWLKELFKKDKDNKGDINSLCFDVDKYPSLTLEDIKWHKFILIRKEVLFPDDSNSKTVYGYQYIESGDSFEFFTSSENKISEIISELRNNKLKQLGL